MSGIEGKSAAALVAMMKSGEVSSREVTAHFIGRIEAVNPRLNAVVVPLFEEAMKRAEDADARFARGESNGRLHGLPFTIKECFDYPGTPSTLGVLDRRTDAPDAFDPYVESMIGEGGIVLGKTNVPQLLIFIESENRVYGRTNNPHNPEFTCGGSSGGEGAIIGAGASPVGVGSDIGGSVRFPAAFCGIASVKPTMWRIPDLTRYGAGILEGPVGSVAGPLGNFAEDLALVLEIMNETAARSRKVEPLGDYRRVDPGGLRIGFFHSDGLFEPMPAVRRAVDESVVRLRNAGAEILEFDLPPLGWAEEIFYRILTVNRGKIFTDVLGDEKPLPQLRNTLLLVKASPAMRRAIGTLAQVFGQRTLRRLLPYFGGEGEAFLREWAEKQERFRHDFLARMEAARIDAIVHAPDGRQDRARGILFSALQPARIPGRHRHGFPRPRRRGNAARRRTRPARPHRRPDRTEFRRPPARRPGRRPPVARGHRPLPDRPSPPPIVMTPDARTPSSIAPRRSNAFTREAPQPSRPTPQESRAP
jgi:fatty acid amide hydrolase